MTARRSAAVVRGFASALILTALVACGGRTTRTEAAAMPAPAVEAGAATVPSPLMTAAPEPAEPAGDAPGWLGVELAAAPRGEAGVLVRGVLRGSPAERAGLLPGDRILRLDHEPVERPPDVVRIVSAHRAGARIGVALQRQGADRLLPVVLAQRPDQNQLLEAEFLGTRAPAFRPLELVRGSAPDSLSALRGKVVVLEFWASWCVACRLSVPTLNAWKDRYGAQGLTVLSVTMDPPAVATEASVELGIEYAVLSDADGETTRVFRALALPTMFVIDREGTVRDVMVGYSQARLARAELKVQELVGLTRVGALDSRAR